MKDSMRQHYHGKVTTPTLPSYNQGSLHRLENLKQKLKQMWVEEAYSKVIEQQKAEGSVEAADQLAQGVECYTPHKPVIREKAASTKSTKVCVMYDASAKCFIVEWEFVSRTHVAEQDVECAG